MTLTNVQQLIHKTCLIGLTYINTNGDILSQSQLAGTVITADEQEGLAVELFKIETKEAENSDKAPAVFHLPPSLAPWFVAPARHYKNTEFSIDIKNPDYFVTWDIVKKRDDTKEGDHEWWEWKPRITAPSVG